MKFYVTSRAKKKYFIDTHITYCYPYDTDKIVEEYGVLSEYIGKCYSREEIDKIICEMITRHPYVQKSMFLKIHVMWRDGCMSGFYHTLTFENDNESNQRRGSAEIKYEKDM